MICEGREWQVRICLYYYGHYLLSDELKVGLKYLVVIFFTEAEDNKLDCTSFTGN